MSTATSEASPTPTPFVLDITLVEDSTAFPDNINLTDDGCGSSCPNSCVTSSFGSD